ncbi:MAG: S9 family peptidase [Firmicutes bacterium]|nr:S9 family peptidase [Bacillota bacterium]
MNRGADAPAHRPYGLWESPIGPGVIAQGIGLEDVAWDETGNRLVWVETRGGRGTLVAARPGGEAPVDLTADLDVRAQVGYGGGELTVAGGWAYFAARPGRLYRMPLDGGTAEPITPPFGHAASPAVSPDGRFVVYVHSAEGVDRLAVVDCEGRMWPKKLVEGEDFYMQPRWSPDGRRVAYVCWNHPMMPWDGTWLRIAHLDVDPDGGADLPRLRHVEIAAGGEDVSVFQPEFSPDGRFLAYVSDETGWWHIYLLELESGRRRRLTSGAAEHGVPAWRQGMRTYAFSPDSRWIYFIRNEAGFHRLWRVAVNGGEPVPVNVLADYATLEQIAVAAPRATAAGAPGANPGTTGEVQIACIASSPRIPPRIVVVRLPGHGAERTAQSSEKPEEPAASRTVVVRRSRAEGFPQGLLSVPRPVQWTAPDGTPVHGLYYPPANPRFRADGPPPAVISIHGGPTSQALPAFNPKAQFFTSRGYAYLDVNYRGSTGYGRAYRNALRGRWGVVDVEDAVGGGRYLAAEGLADESRLVIMGGSAGGYTVLQALALHPGFFRAALCLYGVADLFSLAADTHKFEAHYLDSLVGPLPGAAAVYRERSPVFHAQRIRDPIAIFQGADDRVVPREQSDAIVAALKARGVPHEYHLYEGEGHGFRRPETVTAFYRAVESFLRRYVVFS